MKYILDLFSGTGSATRAFRDSPRYKVIDVELKEKFDANFNRNILELEPEDLKEWDFDLVWASPPCTSFSVASMGHHWYSPGVPKTEKAELGLRLVRHTLRIIRSQNPDYWFMENPRGMLRKIIGVPPANNPLNSEGDFYSRHGGGTVWYCRYGDERAKPTDLWGNHPDSFKYRTCQNGNNNCHDASPRGTKESGTQGMVNNEVRSKIPRGLSEAIMEAVENPESNRGLRRFDMV